MIFIVDDNDSNLMKAASILESDYQVVTMSSAAKMFSLLEKKLPELILLDIEMPEMNGFEAIVKLKENPEWRNIPVIFLTGRIDEEKGLSLGAVDYITKPYSPVIVKLRVQNQIKIINEQLFRARSEFLPRMSHELLTPMNLIIGMTENAEITNNPSKIKHCLNEIGNASNRMVKLIKDVLDISYGKDNLSLTESVFSVNEVVGNVLNMVKAIHCKKQQKLSLDISQSIPSVLVGDKKRFIQLLINLLTNAVKFTPENGEIKLRACVFDEDTEVVMLKFEVEDNGIGISKEQQSTLFEIFVQSDDSVAIKCDGMGVGLALSKLIVETMGGKIWLESELGKGSKFIFTCKFKKYLE